MLYLWREWGLKTKARIRPASPVVGTRLENRILSRMHQVIGTEAALSLDYSRSAGSSNVGDVSF